MPKLILTFDERILKECAIGRQPVIIGRLPLSTLSIDNPAVSAQHARVFRDGDQIVIEDLQSANGTFVNEQLVTRQALRDGDIVLIGKHQLIFSESGMAAEADAPPMESFDSQIAAQGGTMMLDTRKHRDLMAKSGMQPTVAAPAAVAAKTVAKPPAPAATAGVLRVLSGRSDQTEYVLTSHTSLIGKSETALVRLKGWFKPKVAVAIARKGDTYAATPVGGTTKINGQRLSARQDLRDGDVLEVSGVKLEFRSKAH